MKEYTYKYLGGEITAYINEDTGEVHWCHNGHRQKDFDLEQFIWALDLKYFSADGATYIEPPNGDLR